MKSYKIKYTPEGIVADTGRSWLTARTALLPHDLLEHPVEPHSNPTVDEFIAEGGRLARTDNYKHVSSIVWFFERHGYLGLVDQCPDKCQDELLVSAVRGELREKDEAENIAGWISYGSELFRQRFGDRYRSVYRDLGDEIVKVCGEWGRKVYFMGQESLPVAGTALLWVDVASSRAYVE